MDRVLPALVDELVQQTAENQVITLKTLLEMWDMLTLDQVTGTDAQRLLMSLFWLMHWRDDGNAWRVAQRRVVADEAFQVLHFALTNHSPLRESFLAALRSVLDQLDLTEDHLYKRPRPPPSKIREAFTPPELKYSTTTVKEPEAEDTKDNIEEQPTKSVEEAPAVTPDDAAVDPENGEECEDVNTPPLATTGPSPEEMRARLNSLVVDRDTTPLHDEEDVEDDPPALVDGDSGIEITAESLTVDRYLQRPETRARGMHLLRVLDLSGINACFFVVDRGGLHRYLPRPFSARARVFRDFLQCPPRPKLHHPSGPPAFIHIQTNIPAKSDIMYRFLIEGYNYGINAVINSDAVGYTHKRWEKLGCMEEFGWPAGWDKRTVNNYTPGCELSQYYSSEGFVTLRMKAKSFFCVGFTVSAWLVCHGYGAGFQVAATVQHRDDDI